ncbi:hypothetical protein SSYRP_v1c09740 [Spiroplasma syrphidicola EA-1]|uniref:Impact N-terminal domain-containing protein n=1 Tax=Spiroplasma syrphidicola EA-1 TaxID=1276229 RepID=R4UMT8_9MOLU|nr:YigZ family protein [Spiroplasma syrphidicola]AGM26561.1 hypothetical protein SSYRP_v1c09740 [Spiroplasma syrphidicola EA-1]
MNQLTTSDVISNPLIIKKSKFLCLIQKVTSEKAAKDFISAYQDLDATHNCYAYIIGKNADIIRKYDDGEPTNTAGKPIWEVLKANNLTNIVCLVIRYYGGIKLGAGGLIRAYANSVRDCLKLTTLEPYFEEITLQVTCDISKNKVIKDSLFHFFNITNYQTAYHESLVVFTFNLRVESKTDFINYCQVNKISYTIF